jgi:hypothetical protein
MPIEISIAPDGNFTLPQSKDPQRLLSERDLVNELAKTDDEIIARGVLKWLNRIKARMR